VSSVASILRGAILNILGRTLSSSALDALSSFYSERDARLKDFEDLKLQAEQDAGPSPQILDMDSLFAEDWNASQFWV
jgi:hypothetical protein